VLVIAANKPANAQATAATSAALDTDAALESYSAEFEDTPRRHGPNNENCHLCVSHALPLGVLHNAKSIRRDY
jgi:hypothetical protein